MDYKCGIHITHFACLWLDSTGILASFPGAPYRAPGNNATGKCNTSYNLDHDDTICTFIHILVYSWKTGCLSYGLCCEQVKGYRMPETNRVKLAFEAQYSGKTLRNPFGKASIKNRYLMMANT